MNYIPYEIGGVQMVVVQFFENRNILLTQLLNRAPSVGEILTIKGRKVKVSNVNKIDESHIKVEVILEKVKKR